MIYSKGDGSQTGIQINKCGTRIRSERTGCHVSTEEMLLNEQLSVQEAAGAS